MLCRQQRKIITSKEEKDGKETRSDLGANSLPFVSDFLAANCSPS